MISIISLLVNISKPNLQYQGQGQGLQLHVKVKANDFYAVLNDTSRSSQVVLVLSVLFRHSYLTHIAYYYLFIFVDLSIIDII